MLHSRSRISEAVGDIMSLRSLAILIFVLTPLVAHGVAPPPSCPISTTRWKGSLKLIDSDDQRDRFRGIDLLRKAYDEVVKQGTPTQGWVCARRFWHRIRSTIDPEEKDCLQKALGYRPLGNEEVFVIGKSLVPNSDGYATN